MAKVATTGLTISGVPYGEDVKAGDLVGWSLGKLMLACGAAVNPIPAVGVAAAAYRSGEVGAVHLGGEVSGFTNLGVGDTQYLSLTNPGTIQATPPSGSGNLMQVVGYGVSLTRLAVVIRDWGTYL